MPVRTTIIKLGQSLFGGTKSTLQSVEKLASGQSKIVFKNTNKRMKMVGMQMIKFLKDELKEQKHIATGRLHKGLTYKVLTKVSDFVEMNVYSSVDYWKAVNNPRFAKKANYNEIFRWASAKGIPTQYAGAIWKKLTGKKNKKGVYGKPYVFWKEGNQLRRTNFAGHVANTKKAKSHKF